MTAYVSQSVQAGFPLNFRVLKNFVTGGRQHFVIEFMPF